MTKDREILPDISKLSRIELGKIIDSYIDGELSCEAEQQVKAHMESSEEFRLAVEETKQLVQTARSLRDRPIPNAVSRRLRKVLRDRVGHNLLVLF